MTTLLVLCLTAVLLLTAEISAYTYRGGVVDETGISTLLPPKQDVCTPGTCVVEFGRLCFCDAFGISICPVFDIYESPDDFEEIYCQCKPGEILPSTAACVCPPNGRMPVKGCGRSALSEADNPEDLPSVKRRSYDGNVARLTSYRSDGPLRCGYYQCWPTQNGQQCVWIPCNNGR